jgi:hypothetical protein
MCASNAQFYSAQLLRVRQQSPCKPSCAVAWQPNHVAPKYLARRACVLRRFHAARSIAQRHQAQHLVLLKRRKQCRQCNGWLAQQKQWAIVTSHKQASTVLMLPYSAAQLLTHLQLSAFLLLLRCSHLRRVHAHQLRTRHLSRLNTCNQHVVSLLVNKRTESAHGGRLCGKACMMPERAGLTAPLAALRTFRLATRVRAAAV